MKWEQRCQQKLLHIKSRRGGGPNHHPGELIVKLTVEVVGAIIGLKIHLITVWHYNFAYLMAALD